MRILTCPLCDNVLMPKYTPHEKGRGNGWVWWGCKKCHGGFTKGLRRSEEKEWLDRGWIK